MDEEQAELRIGDRDRQAVHERLLQAVADGYLTVTEYDERSARCWAARTRRDLEPLTRDLPDPGSAAPTATSHGSLGADHVPATVTESKSTRGRRIAARVGAAAVVAVALFSGGQVLTSADGSALFSSRTVHVSHDQDRVQVGAMFGKVQVVLPDGVRARTSGTMVFGRMACQRACQGVGDERDVVVEGRGGFGSVDIITSQEHTSGGIGDEDDN